MNLTRMRKFHQKLRGKASSKLRGGAFSACNLHEVCVSTRPFLLIQDVGDLEQSDTCASIEGGEKMTKSQNLWLTLAGWSIFFLVVISLVARSYDLAFDTSSGLTWCFLAFPVWSIGVVPLFIAAIVTRKEKRDEN